MPRDIIRLDGLRYDGESGQRIHGDPTNKRLTSKSPQKATTLNRQYVRKPHVKNTAGLPVKDNRAQKPKVAQFKREIIIPGKKGPVAPGVSHFKRGDFNNTNQTLILDIKPRPDVVVTPEQNQKFIEAVRRAENVDLVRRYYAGQINRQRRKRNDVIHATSNNLARKFVNEKISESKPKDKIAATDSKKVDQAKIDRVVNKAIAEAPSSKQLAKQHVDKPVNTKRNLKKGLAWTATIMVLLALVGGVAYLNWANIKFNLIKQQLGLDTQMPTYTPKGYKLIHQPRIEDKSILLDYSNPDSDCCAYSVKQTKSPLDSTSVLTKLVKPKVGDKYSIHRQNGLVIYTYTQDKSEMVWSNGGVLYQITADSEISTEQLLRLAISL